MENEIKVGTKIKTLIDNPYGGCVKEGEVGIIEEIITLANMLYVNFPSQTRYRIVFPLNKNLFEIISEESSISPDYQTISPIYGRWYKALVDNPISILYLKKGDYAKSDGVDSFLEFSNGSKNVKWACSKFRNDLWELMPEGFNPYNQNEIITNTFGLKIGDTLPKEIINKWCRQGLNYYGNTKKWESQSFFSTDREILSFKLLDGILGFEVSGTANVYLKAKGFKEFMDSFDKKEFMDSFDKKEFEVGKWYKTGFGSIVKYKETTSDNTFIASEHFMFDDLKKLLSTEAKFGTSNIKNFTPLTDLSEIQPYLPEGHPDKINTIPEYVECISSKNNTMFTVGKIYNFTNPFDNEGVKRSIILKGSIWEFKPSTKEAYDAQENSKPKDMEESEFKKGEYIVLIDTPHIIEPYPKNYIFKQRETNNYLLSVLDSEGSKTNGWFPIRYSSKYWRYATPEEITEYERLGKPYDVTRLNRIEELTSLPEKWYCCPENEKQDRILCNWRKGGHSSDFNEAVLLSNKTWIYKRNIDTSVYTKISFELFEKHYLNKSQLPPHLAAANIEDEGPDFSNYKIGYDPIKKETKKHTITDIPTTQPIVIKLNKKINYLIPKSI